MSQRIPRRTLLRRAGAAVAATLGVPGLRAGTPEPITIWFTVEGAKALREIGRGFTAQTGVPLVVETPDEGPAKFQQTASAGKGPDAFFYAHDRIGEWTASGLLHAVSPPRRMLDDLDPLALKGYTLRGRLWGYPTALEAITLIYNKALVPQPPASFEDVLALDAKLKPQGKRAILWDYTNNYFSWPLLAAHGGYAFRERADGSFDERDTGVNNAGALIGAELIERLVKEGYMPAGSGYAEMEAGLAQGRVAMMINGPWAWVNLRRIGIDFGVARIPAVAGKRALPYVGVKGILVNRATKQRELVVEFIENHLLTPQGLRLVDRAEPIGAPASRAFYNELLADPKVGDKVAGIMASARDGVPTPSIPEMGRFWAAMKASLQTMSEGRQTAKQALDTAARRITAT